MDSDGGRIKITQVPGPTRPVIRFTGRHSLDCDGTCVVFLAMFFRRTARLGVLLVMLPGYALSQESGPKVLILVEITDISGAAVPGATVQIQHVSPPNKFLGATNEVGEFHIQLAAGKYTVSIMDSGFKTLTQQIEVTNAENQRFDFVLQVGTCSPCVEVIATPPSDASQGGSTGSLLYPSTADKTSTAIESKLACHDVPYAKPLPPPGPACERDLFVRRGRPFMFAARNGIAYGISFNPEKHSELYLCAENRTDQSIELQFCCGTTLLDAIIIYNSDRHRVLSKSDELARKARSEGQQLVQACTCSGSVIVPAHTIQLFVSANISLDYSLSPGRYIITERNPQGDFHLKSDWTDDLPQSPAGLEVSIP
jgi:hypothetical protein